MSDGGAPVSDHLADGQPNTGSEPDTAGYPALPQRGSRAGPAQPVRVVLDQSGVVGGMPLRGVGGPPNGIRLLSSQIRTWVRPPPPGIRFGIRDQALAIARFFEGGGGPPPDMGGEPESLPINQSLDSGRNIYVDDVVVPYDARD